MCQIEGSRCFGFQVLKTLFIFSLQACFFFRQRPILTRSVLLSLFQPNFYLPNQCLMLLMRLKHCRLRKRCLMKLCVVENPGQRVVILLWNRIKLVIMTSGTGDREPQQATRQRIHTIVQCFRACLSCRQWIPTVRNVGRSKGEKTRRHRLRRIHQITSNLSPQKIIHRPISVQ